LNVVDENKISIWKFLSPAKIELPGTVRCQLLENLETYLKDLGFTEDPTTAEKKPPEIRRHLHNNYWLVFF